MKVLFFITLLIPGVSSGQVTSKTLNCDCLVGFSSTQTCREPAKVPFSIKFSGQTAVMRMREHNFRLSFDYAYVDPDGVRSSVYVKKGEVTVSTTFPVARNFVIVSTDTGQQEITSAFCRE